MAQYIRNQNPLKPLDIFISIFYYVYFRVYLFLSANQNPQ